MSDQENVRAMSWPAGGDSMVWQVPELLLRPLQLSLNNPGVVYVIALGTFLLKPPDVDLAHIDRIAFGTLCAVVAFRVLLRREKLPFVPWLSLPMAGLTCLAVLRAMQEPFETQAWSLVAAKFVVPFVLFHVAMLVFEGQPQESRLEIFTLVTLAYLIFTALAFLIGARGLIFPRFILDESIGFHVDRARGPFLQAVANGVSLNLLGLLAGAVTGNRSKKAARWLWFLLPWAVLATMTRSVWIGFAVSGIVIYFRKSGRARWRRSLLALAAAGLFVGFVVLGSHSLRNALVDRTEESGPVNARIAVYQSGWSMIEERPLAGWPFHSMYRELARRMPGYRLHAYFVHNTYLSLLLEFGIPGMALYGIIIFNLFRLGRRASTSESAFVSGVRKIWPLFLGVYLFNACFVDMAYQFVIVLVFTVAGMLAVTGKAGA